MPPSEITPAARPANPKTARNPAGQTDNSLRLIDSSVWIRSDQKGKSAMRDRLNALINGGSARICWPIHTELLIGVKDEEQWNVANEGLSAIERIPIADSTWRQASSWGWKLARRGQTVPLIDLLIGAAAVEADLALWTIDLDFDRIASITNLRLDRFGSK